MVEPWYSFLFEAFDALRYDRFYGAMGGESPISYMAMSRFAEDHEIRGEDFARFRLFIKIIDGIHIEVAARNAKT